MDVPIQSANKEVSRTFSPDACNAWGANSLLKMSGQQTTAMRLDGQHLQYRVDASELLEYLSQYTQKKSSPIIFWWPGKQSRVAGIVLECLFVGDGLSHSHILHVYIRVVGSAVSMEFRQDNQGIAVEISVHKISRAFRDKVDQNEKDEAGYDLNAHGYSDGNRDQVSRWIGPFSNLFTSTMTHYQWVLNHTRSKMHKRYQAW